MNPKPGYPTLGNYVYLGRVTGDIRRNAKRAGLEIINAAQFRKLYDSLTAGDRIVQDGTWYNTVRYQ